MVFILEEEISFPPVELAEPDGLLAVGGDLSVLRLLEAYRSGIFPWYEGDEILWWSPDPRFVLFPDEYRPGKTIPKLIRDGVFEFTVNKVFSDVIHHCKSVKRREQEGTWITDEMERSYTQLHELGYAQSAEVWKDGKLAGGLYGVRIGKVFCGESMFSLEPNASRYALTCYIDVLKKDKISLIDCQVHTQYLESCGARFIERKAFLEVLRKGL